MEVVAPFTRQMAERCGVLQMKSRARTRNAQAQRKTCSSSTSIVPLAMNWRYTSSRWYVRDIPNFSCRLCTRTIACSIPKYETHLSQFSVLPRFCEETPEAHTQQGPIHACCFTVGNARTQSKIKGSTNWRCCFPGNLVANHAPETQYQQGSPRFSKHCSLKSFSR